jgi:uncharacterized 2Fe-2S/4Fe-4S cluster protein (DUF4445 family)
VSGDISEPTASERAILLPREIEDGWRLACQTYPAGDCRLSVPPDSMSTSQRIQVEAVNRDLEVQPAVQARKLTMPEPSMSDLRADSDRLLEAINDQHGLDCSRIDIDVVRTLSPQLRSYEWTCQVSVRDGEVVSLGPWPGRHLGLAVDLGTTKIAAYLVDLGSGHTLAALGAMNPQISYGEDVISRINCVVNSPQEGPELRRVAVEAVSRLASDLCASAGADSGEIVEAVVVGNTAMHHLLLGLPVRQLALSPYVPAAGGAIDVKARDLGLGIAPGAYVHLLPNIAGFVGADHVAMLLAIDAAVAEGTTLALDIGTNTEVSLVAGGRMTSVSCASGPAFEGYHIEQGMRAASGAIERVEISAGGILYQTIDHAPPVGICGSGALDALAQLYLTGVIDAGGRMAREHPRIRTRGNRREFVLVGDVEEGGETGVVFTQGDVRELQLAKAAIRSGIQALIEDAGCAEDDIDRVIIAGAFGTYISVASAVAAGMLPPLPLDRFHQVGNAAGLGARMALLSTRKRDEARAIAAQAGYIELASAPGFKETFVEASYLGRYHLKDGTRQQLD